MVAAKRILITGGSGFIGGYVCRVLREKGLLVRVLDLHEPPFEVDYVRGDVRDSETVARALVGVDEVIHLAAAHHDFGIDRATFFSVNADGARILCEGMTEAGIDRLCFTSSVAVYGDSPDRSEANPKPLPNNAYGESKLRAESIVREWAEAKDSRAVVIIRPAVVFGPKNHGNMFTLIRAVDRGWYWPVGSGRNVKSTAYVENLVGALLHAMSTTDFGLLTFNYVDKPDLNSREIGDLIFRCLGRRPRPPFPLPLALAIGRVGDIIGRFVSWNVPLTTARVRKLACAETLFPVGAVVETGFRPTVPLEEGLRRMVEWYKTEGRSQDQVSRIPPAEVVRATQATL